MSSDIKLFSFNLFIIFWMVHAIVNRFQTLACQSGKIIPEVNQVQEWSEVHLLTSHQSNGRTWTILRTWNLMSTVLVFCCGRCLQRSKHSKIAKVNHCVSTVFMFYIKSILNNFEGVQNSMNLDYDPKYLLYFGILIQKISC